MKQHAFRVDPLRDLNGFSNAHTLMFFDIRQRGGLKPRKGIEIKVLRQSRVEISIPPDLPTGPIPTEKAGQKGGHSEF